MIIAGLQNLSLVDYPGNLAAAVFVQGCNFKCGYCQNPLLVPLENNSNYPEKNIFDYLERRKNVIDAVVVSGGEPTIHKDLPDFIKRIKDSGFKVKLDTNGGNPQQLENLLREDLLDYVAIDIKTSWDKYSLVASGNGVGEKVLQSAMLVMLSEVPYEFRTTCVPDIVEEKDFFSIGESLKGAKRYYLQQFRPLETYDKSFEQIKPYNLDEILKFKEILEGFVVRVDVRGL